MRRLRVAVTINISSPTESFFTNGVKQNAINLKNLLINCQNVEEVKFLNLGSQRDLSTSPWKKYESDIIYLHQVIDNIDIIISLMSGVPLEISKEFQSKGIKIVKQAVGTEYHMFTEYMLFQDNPPTGFDQRSPHQAVWILPHHYEANKDYFEILCQTKAYKSPFIWSPKFLEEEIALHTEYKVTGGTYVPKNDLKKISVIEPNINMVKTCLTPMLASEKLFELIPNNFKKVSIFCSKDISIKKDFIKFVKSLNVYNNKKLFFEGRYHILFTLQNHTDIVLSHQRDLELNYAYFDVVWLGYPLVHNSNILKNLGYYYEGFDASAAAKQMENIINNFDSVYQDYLLASRELISNYLPENINNIKAYEELIDSI